MYVRLSHILDSETPTYKHAPGFSSAPRFSISKGDAVNTRTFAMMTHVGTHVDAPHHFLNNMKTIDSFDISAFVFERPALIDIRKSDSELITRSEIERVKDRIVDKDLLLIRTGFGELRLAQRERYEFSGPGLSSGAAEYLRNFPELRAIGFDFISLNAPKLEEDGYKAHRILLSKDVEKGFFIIEDMELRADLKPPKKVIVAPLFAAGFDGGPCTVLAET